MTDKLVPAGIFDSIKLIDEKIAKLKYISDSVYKTSGRLTGFPKSIKEETNVSELLKMASTVIAKERAYDEAALVVLGQNATYPTFKQDGFTKDEYLEDIKLRVAIINHQAHLEELQTMRKEFEELMGKEERKAILAEKLEKYLAAK